MKPPAKKKLKTDTAESKAMPDEKEIIIDDKYKFKHHLEVELGLELDSNLHKFVAPYLIGTGDSKLDETLKGLSLEVSNMFMFYMKKINNLMSKQCFLCTIKRSKKK